MRSLLTETELLVFVFLIAKSLRFRKLFRVSEFAQLTSPLDNNQQSDPNLLISWAVLRETAVPNVNLNNYSVVADQRTRRQRDRDVLRP